MAGEGRGAGSNFIKGAPVSGQRGWMHMHESSDEHVCCNTDTERAKLVRVKATVSISLPLSLPHRPRGICMRKRIAASARIVALGQLQLQKYFIQPRAPGGYDERNNCSRLCTFPVNRTSE